MFDVKKGALEQLQPLAAEGFVLADARFDRLNGWTYVIMQLQEARRSLDLSEKYNSIETLDTLEQLVVAHSLYRSAIMGYGKCYASAASGKVTLNRNAVFKGNCALNAKHQRMIDIRNSFAAHNGEKNIDTATMAVKESTDAVFIRHTYTLATPLNEYRDHREVLDHVDRFVVLAVNKFLDRLQMELGKPIRLG